MPARAPLRQLAADTIARVALRFPIVERLLLAGTRRPFLRRHLRLGAIALGYPRVLQRRELRIAEMDGYRFHVNVGESLGVEPYFFRESGTAWFTRSLVRPGDICVDAGANAGHYTFLLASVVGPRGRVFAFEPNPEFASLIRRSITLNEYAGFVELREVALWSVGVDSKQFYVSIEPTNTGTSSLVDHGWFLSRGSTIDVRTECFDDFAKDAGVQWFRLLKIDVERAEDAVLEGARKTLAQHRIDYLIVEMHQGSRAHHLLEAVGYDGYLLIPEDRELRLLSRVTQGHFGDYLFVRPGLLPPKL